MEFDQLIEYDKRNIFLKKSCKKWGRETSPRPPIIYKKVLYELKASGPQLSFNICW